ncbi:MAG TPA: DUF6174 domain-containing protein [Nocardioides sp.]
MDTDNRQDLKVLGAIVLGCAVVAALVWLVWLSPGAAARRDLGDARDRWEAHEPSSYAFDYFYCGGMCAYCPVHVTVTDGVVTDAVMSGDACDGGPVQDAPTMEDMFDVAADHHAGLFDHSSSATYDREWGYPTLVQLTCPPGTMDCGGGWSVTGFEVIAQ